MRQGAEILESDWIGKALKWSAAGATFTLAAVDIYGNVLFKETVDVTLDTTAQLLETIISGDTATIFDGTAFDTAISDAGGFGEVAPKIAYFIVDDITGGTITLQSAAITSEHGKFPHTHGSIVAYDLAAVTDGDKIGIRGDF